MLSKIMPFLAALLVFSACDSYDFPGMAIPNEDLVNERFAQSMAYNAAHPERVLTLQQDAYHVHVGSDVHMERNTQYLDSFLAVTRADELNVCNFVNGDLVNIEGSFPYVQDAFQRHYQAGGDTIFVTAGNHDLYYNQWPLFRQFFGTSTYTVSIQTPQAQDLIICLESAAATLGRDQSQWLVKVLETQRPLYRYCVVITHTNLFDTDNSQFPSSNPPLTETYALSDLFQRHGVNLCLQAHDHQAERRVFKNVEYVQSFPLKPKSHPKGYLRLEVDAQDLKTVIIEDFLPTI